MSYTLSTILVDLYGELGQLTVSTATSAGTTATIVDNKQANKIGDEDSVSWAAFIIEDAGGEGAAPEGEMALVTSYADSTGTFTSPASSYTVAPSTGDVYGFTNDFYPYFDMIQVVNRALKSLGEVPLTDTTTLDTAASQTEYACAVDWKRSRPLRIDVQTKTTDANDNQWQKLWNWDYIPAAAGSTSLIILPQLPAGKGLRIWYLGVHGTLSAYNDDVNEHLPDQLVLAACVEKALVWQNSRMQGGDDFLLQRLNDARQELAIAKATYAPWRPRRDPNLLILSRGVDSNNLSVPEV